MYEGHRVIRVIRVIRVYEERPTGGARITRSKMDSDSLNEQVNTWTKKFEAMNNELKELRAAKGAGDAGGSGGGSSDNALTLDLFHLSTVACHVLCFLTEFFC